MNETGAEILLAVVIIAWATSLPVVRLWLGDFSTFNLICIRYGIAFILLLPVYAKRLSQIRKKTLLHGGILGLLFFCMIAVELWALKMTQSSSETSFLENTAIVLVPLMEAVLHRKRPENRTLFNALVTLLGVGLILMVGGSLRLDSGALLCMLCALIYAVYIIVTDRLSRSDDPLLIGVLQNGVVGLLGLAATFFFETPRMPAGGAEWGGVLFLTVVCSVLGTTLQPLAQSRVPSERACVYCALNPLTAAILGVAFLNEPFGLSLAVGALLILTGIFLSSRQNAAAD